MEWGQGKGGRGWGGVVVGVWWGGSVPNLYSREWFGGRSSQTGDGIPAMLKEAQQPFSGPRFHWWGGAAEVGPWLVQMTSWWRTVARHTGQPKISDESHGFATKYCCGATLVIQPKSRLFPYLPLEFHGILVIPFGLVTCHAALGQECCYFSI